MCYFLDFLGSKEHDYIKTQKSQSAIAVYVGCIFDPVISVRVLRLLHKNSVDYSLLLKIQYNLLIPNYSYRSGALLYQLDLTT